MLDNITFRLFRLSQSSIDLLVIAVIGIAALGLFVEIELYETINRFHATHEAWEADEIFMALPARPACGCGFPS